MKQHFYFILLLAFITLFSCASTSVEAENKDLYYENQQTGEKLLIDEWKYMGFGYPFPHWILPALENNIQKIKEFYPEIMNDEIVILQSKGYNLDQAESGLKNQLVQTDFKLFESSWISGDFSNKINDKIEKMYISVAVYHKK